MAGFSQNQARDRKKSREASISRTSIWGVSNLFRKVPVLERLKDK
jgi:hypothetical protein